MKIGSSSQSLLVVLAASPLLKLNTCGPVSGTGRSQVTVATQHLGSSQCFSPGYTWNCALLMFFFFFFCQAHHCGAFIQKHSSIVTVFPLLTVNVILNSKLLQMKRTRGVVFFSFKEEQEVCSFSLFTQSN